MKTKVVPLVAVLGCFFVCCIAGAPRSQAQSSNVTVRVMASNLTSGNNQRYETPGLNILKGLKPDIVAMQEFNVSNSFGINTTSALSNMVATTFDTNFVYFRESGYSIPNGIISRYPILASGSWVDSDTGVNDRGFAWARIDVPGTNDLYVVSVHLKASSGAANETRRAAEVAELKDLITTNFPAGAWIIVAGDMNLYSETEAAITSFKTFLSDAPVPADQNGDPDTNAGRAERYDRVLPSFSMTNTLIPIVMPSRTYTNGLVFDSRVYTPLAEVFPVVSTDSGASNMQHMGVVRDFQITIAVTNSNISPVITNQPQSLAVAQGGNATFSVVAGGTAPITYQWRFNLANISGATSSSYTRSNVQPAHVGNYSVVVSNSAGFTTSSNAALTLIVPQPVLTMPLAGVMQWQGLSNLTYTVQTSTNLAQTNWTTLGTAVSPNTAISFTNAPATNTERYYRVVYP